MSEKLGNHSEEVAESSASILEEEAGQFDPQKAEAERQKVLEEQESSKEKVLSRGEVSTMSEDENGKAVLKSEYMDAFSKYKEGENYDKNDYELGKAIWGVGMSAALLDVDKDVIEELKNGEGTFYDSMLKDSRVLHVFDKACEDMKKIAESDNEAAAEEAIEYIKSTGKVGEFIVDGYEAWLEGKAIFRSGESETKQKETEQEKTRKPDEKEYLDKLSTLEKRFSKLGSGNGYDTEELEELAASYRQLQGKIYDPKTREKIEERYNYLAGLRDRFESIQGDISRM